MISFCFPFHSHDSLGKKYVAKVCESIQEKIQGK